MTASTILDHVAEAVCGTARANNLDISDLQAERIARSAVFAYLAARRSAQRAATDEPVADELADGYDVP